MLSFIAGIKSYFHRKLARPMYGLMRLLQPVFNFKKRTFFDKFKVKTPEGNSFWLYNNAFTLETEIFWIGYNHINWEKKTREIWSNLAKNSQVILDIGANTGIFSVIAKAHNEMAKIHAFEPQPNIFKVLEKNNQINHFDIHNHQLALSDESGELPFYNTGYSTFEDNNTTHGSLNKEWRTENQHSILVPVYRLDTFIENNEIKGVDLIKIDVETLEFEVLKGYGKYLFQHRPLILLEVQNDQIGENIKRLLDAEDYLFFWVNEEKGLIQVDNPGFDSDQNNHNYLICPREKVYLVEIYIVNG